MRQSNPVTPLTYQHARSHTLCTALSQWQILCRCPMKGSTVGFAAVGLLLLGIFLMGSTKAPHSSGSTQGQSHSPRRTLIGRQEEVELLDIEVIEQQSEEDGKDQSFYTPWIEQDFAVWQEAGIKQVKISSIHTELALLNAHAASRQLINSRL